MAKLIECDHCKKRAPLPPLNWLVLDVDGGYLELGQPYPLHFCTLACVEGYLKALREAGRRG